MFLVSLTKFKNTAAKGKTVLAFYLYLMKLIVFQMFNDFIRDQLKGWKELSSKLLHEYDIHEYQYEYSCKLNADVCLHV